MRGMPGTPPLGPAAPPRVRVRTPPLARCAAAALVVVAIAVAVLAAPARAAGPPSGCAGAAVPLGAAAPAAVEAAIACLVGAQRAAHGLPPVRPAAALGLAARRHAADMVARGYFAHVSPTGGSVDRRARRAGYLDEAPCWALGEDLGWAPPALATAEAVVAAWMASPSHRSVVLDRDFREIGVAVAGRAPVGEVAGATFVLELGATMACARSDGGASGAPRARVRAG
jgi:uncharacterized protein YkwD